MRILLIHNDALYFGGAENMLRYYLEALPATDCQPTVAAVRGSRVSSIIPPSVGQVWIPEKQRFSILKLCRQFRQIMGGRQRFPFDLVHGWTARDWELTSVVGRCARRPAVGTLHDHPCAAGISPSRRLLMRWCAQYGLRRVICVSRAV